jgi:hypothetical protein
LACPREILLALTAAQDDAVVGIYWWLGFDDFAATQAGGADSDAFGGSAYFGVHRAQIHIPAPLGDVMGVADIVSELRPFAAEFTYLCH